MSLPFVTQVRFINNSQDIKKLCVTHFGKERRTKYKMKSGRKIHNRGKWRFNQSGKVSFRNEKDLILFILLTSQLGDHLKRQEFTLFQ